MAKRQKSSVLNRLSGKTLVFSGKFDYGVEDRLKAMAEAQQGTVCDELHDKVDYLVLADLTAGKTIQKKAASLNAKGATIQVIDVDGFKNLAEPTVDEILMLLRAGEAETYAKTRWPVYHHAKPTSPKYTFNSEDFDAASFQNAHLDEIHFESCSFTGAKFGNVRIGPATDCDFSATTSASVQFGDVPRCRFTKSTLIGCCFVGDFSETDFNSAVFNRTTLCGSKHPGYGATTRALLAGVCFISATLKSTGFQLLHLKTPDFTGADLSKALFANCSVDSGLFRNAVLREAVFVDCKLAGCDFTDADLSAANLAGADLTGAILAGADLSDANLRGAKLDGVDFTHAKNYDPSSLSPAVIGPALTELDS